MTDIPEGDFVDLERNNGGVCSPSSGSSSSPSTSRPIDMVTFIDIIILLKTEKINVSKKKISSDPCFNNRGPHCTDNHSNYKYDIPDQNMLMISWSARRMKFPCTFFIPAIIDVDNEDEDTEGNYQIFKVIFRPLMSTAPLLMASSRTHITVAGW